MNKVQIIMASALVIAGCSQQGKTEKVPAIDLSNLDTTVAPGADFYKYATGGWQKNNPLPSEYARYGSFDVISENNIVRINELFQEMTTLKTEKGSVEQKIADLYKQGLDSARLNQEGAEPIKKYLDEIYAISDIDGIYKEIAKLHDEGNGVFFRAGVMADLMNSDIQVLSMSQGGLGIGNRDYYVDSKNADIKEGYRQFLAKVFALVGNDDPQKAADNALAVEDFLALNSWTSVQERDVEASYNPMSTDQIESSYKGLGFDVYCTARNIPSQDKIIIGEPSFFAALSSWLPAANLDEVKDYMAAQVIEDATDALSDDFYAASFDFFSKQMSGVQEQKPRWKRAMSVPNRILGQAVGKMYVAKYFPESSKEKMKTLVENLRLALGQHVDELDWMSDTTKAKAHEKLDNFTVKIGYPDVWKDYSTLEIDPALSYYENMRSASKWYVADNMTKIGKPTDKTEWGMTPQTVNAYYDPSSNEICFPAAILQPPFFNPDADDAVNYGGIGVVIGHEMSHGFDDQGRLFDKDGNMNSWWTPADDEKFKEKAEKLAAQFDSIIVVPGLHADGHLTLGENIGDHGGLSIAFTAMENAIKDNRPGLIDGFTPEQRFYLSYGQIWAQNITDAEKARRTKLDVHSIGENRVNVSIRNFQSFFDAFGIKEGDPMYRPESERVHIW